MSRANLNRRRTRDHIFSYIGGALNTTKPYDRYLNCLRRVVNQPHRYRFYARAGQPPRRTPKMGPAGVCIYTQSRIGICDYERVSSRRLCSLRYKSNHSSGGRQFYPERPAADFPDSLDYLRSEDWIGTIFRTPSFYVGA